ncbi:MAG: TRAP transporter large permease [Azospirillaceae bacterium]
MLALILFGSMLGLMMLGVPIFFAIGLAGLIGALHIGAAAPLIIVPIGMFNGMDSFPLMAIPFFILAGELMNRGGISTRLVAFASAVVGHISGGLGHANVVSNAMMASMSGSALANIAAVGRVLIEPMEKEGYKRDFATAITVAASLLGPIIPPSITMVIYAITAGTSVGAMFLAGIVPGIIVAIGMMVVIWRHARKRNYPVHDRFSIRRVAVTAKDAAISLMMPVIILGGIFGGVMTPTESAAVAVVYALIVGLVVFRELKLRDLGPILLNSGVVTSFIFLIVGAARVFSDLMTGEAVPQEIASLILSISDEPVLLLLLINILLLFVGCMMDTTAAILILVPVLLPVAIEIGVDPLLFGVMMSFNLVIGLATPPVGVALFLGSDTGKVRIEALVARIWPFLLIYVAVLLLITYVPIVSLGLPRLFGY